MLSNSILAGKLRDLCHKDPPTREALTACCREVAQTVKSDCVLIAHSNAPESFLEVLAFEGKQELADACLYRLGVEDRAALSKLRSKVYSDITGKPVFNRSGSLKIQRPSSGVLMVHLVPKSDFLLLGILDQDMKTYEKSMVADLEEVWAGWKEELLRAVHKILSPSAPPAKPAFPAPETGIGKPLPKVPVAESFPSSGGTEGSEGERRRPVVLVDEVTRLFNKDYFEECLAIEVERAKRYSRNVSLIYLGVTPLGAGMTPLEANVTATQVAEVLAKSLRKVDVICRLENNKYGIILPDTADNTYGIIAKRVFKFFKQVMGESPSVFLNISASTYPKHAGNHLLLMKNAEELLGQARQVGPNKAVLPE